MCADMCVDVRVDMRVCAHMHALYVMHVSADGSSVSTMTADTV